MSSSSESTVKNTWIGQLLNIENKQSSIEDLNKFRTYRSSTKLEIDVPSMYLSRLNPLTPCFVSNLCASLSPGNDLVDNSKEPGSQFLKPLFSDFQISKLNPLVEEFLPNKSDRCFMFNTESDSYISVDRDNLRPNEKVFVPTVLNPLVENFIPGPKVHDCYHTDTNLVQVQTMHACVSDEPDYSVPDINESSQVISFASLTSTIVPALPDVSTPTKFTSDSNEVSKPLLNPHAISFISNKYDHEISLCPNESYDNLDITSCTKETLTPDRNLVFTSSFGTNNCTSRSFYTESICEKTPDIFNISTPDMSFSEQTSVDHYYIFSHVHELGAYTFIFTLSLIIMFAILFGPKEGNSDEKDDPKSILQALRLKNIDKVILGQLNINSIRNKIHLLSDIITNRVDIFLITETKIDHTFPVSQFLIEGYSEPYRLDRTTNGGGLLLYIRNDIPAKSLPLVAGNIECVFLEVTISKKKWLVIGTYNPKKSMISKHLSTLENNLRHYLPSYDNVVIMGDFNSEIREDAMDDFCELYHLKNLIKTPTCFKSNENPSCIDLILTNKQKSFQNSMTVETGLSDFHMLTVTVLKTTFRKLPPKVVRYRDKKNYDPVNFLNDVNFHLAGIDMNQISHDEYNSKIMEIFNWHQPLKTKYIRGNNQPFMTKDIRKEHMKRTRLLNKFRKEKTTINEVAYKKQRNLCVNLLRKTKKLYFENLKPSCISDNKKFWKVIKPLFSEKAMSNDSITLIENNKMMSKDSEVAEIFNSFFSNAVKNLNIDSYEHFSFDEYFLRSEPENKDPIIRAIEKYENHPSIQKIKQMNFGNSTLSFKPTNLEQVLKEVNNLDETKSTPIESLPASVLKDISDTICPKLVIDFNSAIKTGIYPHTPKLADVSALFKKAIKQFKENYRPVSVLSAISKIFGRLILKQTRDYMRDKLSIFICGFTEKMNAQNCLTFMVEKMRKSLDKGEKFGVLLTDLSKAFDCLVHDLLIAKLHAYGFDYLALKLMYTYLTGRLQRVRVNGCFSDWHEIDTGVPQGSILGGELYNYNSNDLFMFLMLDVANYADDNSPFSTAPTIPQIISNLEQEAVIILDWLRNNGLKANPDKFHLLLSEPNEDLSMKIANYEIKNEKLQTLLGVQLETKLNFTSHVTNLCKKASNKLHALSRVSKYMTFNQRKTILASFIIQQFGYCPLVWIFHSRKLNNRINQLHERSLRIVYQDEQASFEDLLSRDGSFTIHHHNVQTLCIELYKVAYGISPELMKLVFPLNPRGKFVWENIFQTHNVKTTTWGLETLGHIGPKIWSEIPTEFKKLPLSKFVKEIRKWKPKCPCRMCKLYIKDLGYVTVRDQNR